MVPVKGVEFLVRIRTRKCDFATHTDYLDSYSGCAGVTFFRWRQPWAHSRDPTPLTLWIWKSSTWFTKSLGSRSQRANHPAIRRRTKSGRPRYASVSSPSLATAGWISTRFSTECLRAYRSRLGRRRPTETTFSQQRLIQRKPRCKLMRGRRTKQVRHEASPGMQSASTGFRQTEGT